MKKLIILSVLATLFLTTNLKAQELSPYFKVADLIQNIETVSTSLNDALLTDGWDVIGTYNPAGNSNLSVICFKILNCSFSSNICCS